MKKFVLALAFPGLAAATFAGLVPRDPAVRYAGFKSRVGTFTLEDKPEYWNFDLRNRTEAQDAYWNIYTENAKVPFAWTGDAAALKPGETSAEWRAALIRALNYQRYYFWGADEVVYAEQTNLPASEFGSNDDGTLTDKTTREAVQAGVTVLAANNAVTHNIGGFAGATSLAKVGASADLTSVAGSANRAVESFIVDPGANNTILGHRRNMFAPNPFMDVGTASRGSFQVTGLFNDSLSDFYDTYRGHQNGILSTWPQKDTYIPYHMLSLVKVTEGIRFSVLLANLPDASGATVTVKRDGTPLSVSNVRGTMSGLGFDVAVPDVGVAPAKDQKYDVTVTNPYGDGASYSYSFLVFDPSQVATGNQPSPKTAILNLSTRGIVGAGENVMIAGFVVEGKEPVRVAIRAQGPSLKQFGLTSTAVNPQLDIYAGQTPLGTLNDWKQSPNFRLVQSYNLAPKEDVDPVTICTLNPGPYTAVVSEVNSANSGGVGIVEVFNMDGNSRTSLVNVSTRGLIGTGEKVMIAGIVLRERTTVVVRTQGPGLARFGLSGVAAGTRLEVYNGSGKMIDENTGWKAAGNERLQGDLSFLAPSDDKEAARVLTLDSGSYTFKVYPLDGEPGVGLVEVFEVK